MPAVPEPPECALVLASASPRRRRLVQWLGIPFTVTSADTPEDLDSPLATQPERLAEHLAAEKARTASEESSVRAQVILAFDTIVVHEDAVLGKPVDPGDARRMLRSLSGATHQVVTGVAILAPGSDEPRTFSATTNVRMKPLSDEDIAEWMASGEYLGCAGAYNIEAQVAEVDDDECFQNVAGLPLCHVAAALADLTERLGDGCELRALASPIPACDQALARTCVLGPRVFPEPAAKPDPTPTS